LILLLGISGYFYSKPYHLKIGNFNIEQRNGETVVDYHRTLKDWLDILLYLILGIGPTAFIVVMYQHTHFEAWIWWAVAFLFAFFAFIKLAEGFTRLTQPTRSIIVINNKDNKLVAKYPYLRKTIINLEDINRIQLSGVNERIRTSPLSASSLPLHCRCATEASPSIGQIFGG